MFVNVFVECVMDRIWKVNNFLIFLTNWLYICSVFICLSGGFCSVSSDWSKIFVHDVGVSLWVVVERIRLLVCGFG